MRFSEADLLSDAPSAPPPASSAAAAAAPPPGVVPPAAAAAPSEAELEAAVASATIDRSVLVAWMQGRLEEACAAGWTQPPALREDGAPPASLDRLKAPGRSYAPRSAA